MTAEGRRSQPRCCRARRRGSPIRGLTRSRWPSNSSFTVRASRLRTPPSALPSRSLVVRDRALASARGDHPVCHAPRPSRGSAVRARGSATPDPAGASSCSRSGPGSRCSSRRSATPGPRGSAPAGSSPSPCTARPRRGNGSCAGAPRAPGMRRGPSRPARSRRLRPRSRARSARGSPTALDAGAIDRGEGHRIVRRRRAAATPMTRSCDSLGLVRLGRCRRSRVARRARASRPTDDASHDGLLSIGSSSPWRRWLIEASQRAHTGPRSRTYVPSGAGARLTVAWQPVS